MMRATITTALVALAVIGATPTPASAQDSLAAARDLYAAAHYEDALASLDRLRGGTRSSDEQRGVEQYRAFCLLALGRASDADRAIETVVGADPLYRPSDSELSPRLRTAFTAVRRRMLPSLVERRYAEAKASFDRKDYLAATAGFAQVQQLLADPDMGESSHQAPYSDIATLAAGFRELAAKAAAPPALPPPVTTLAVGTPAPVVAPQPPRVYGSDDPGVVAPAAIAQALPPYRGRVLAPVNGVLELVIDERGAVATARMLTPTNTDYDNQVLAVARTWQYKPATIDGRPVRFRRFIQIAMKPTA